MFDRELDYYGITPNDSITTQESLAKTIASFAQAKLKHNAFLLALECHYQFGQRMLHDLDSDYNVCICIDQKHRLYGARFETKHFSEYLERYFGLALHGLRKPNTTSQFFDVCLKK